MLDNIFYILENNIPVPCEDALEWARWMQSEKKIICQETVKNYFVSTVFLGFVHSHGTLFETMVFDSKGRICFMLRGHTWAEAQVIHKKIVSMIIELKETF
ncbi:MAG: hypothetical protein ACRC11_10795 [Xenococcaceae cyanobacterium]